MALVAGVGLRPLRQALPPMRLRLVAPPCLVAFGRGIARGTGVQYISAAAVGPAIALSGRGLMAARGQGNSGKGELGAESDNFGSQDCGMVGGQRGGSASNIGRDDLMGSSSGRGTGLIASGSRGE